VRFCGDEQGSIEIAFFEEASAGQRSVHSVDIFILAKLGFLLKFGVLFKFLVQPFCIVSNYQN
jgi:hypothetical protein